MKTKLAHDVQKAELTLRAEITAALNKFTETTGLIVPSVLWHSSSVYDANGNIVETDYYNFSNSVSTGI